MTFFEQIVLLNKQRLDAFENLVNEKTAFWDAFDLSELLFLKKTALIDVSVKLMKRCDCERVVTVWSVWKTPLH